MRTLTALAALAALAGCASAHPAIGPMKADGATCSAALIAPDAILTAAHCLSAAPATAWTFKGAKVRGIVAKGATVPTGSTSEIVAGFDWAVLRIDALSAAPLPVAVMTAAEIVGAIADGSRLDGCELVKAAPRYMTTTCRVRPGNSGGPVLLIDQDGTTRIIGVYVAFGETALAATTPQELQ